MEGDDRDKGKARRVVPIAGGLGAVVLLAISGLFEGAERGLYMGAAIGIVLVFVIVGAFVATRRDSNSDSRER